MDNYFPFEKDCCRPDPCAPCPPPPCSPVPLEKGCYRPDPCAPCPPPPCSPVPPPIAPIMPIPGYNPQQQMQYVVAKANECIERWNHIQANCYDALQKCIGACVANDVYYDRDEVKLENGYDTNDLCNYSIIRIKNVDKAGRPIRVKLGLAYDNTTNSGVNQPMPDFSFVKNANAMITAVSPSAEKWEGTSMQGCAPIASEPAAGKYVAGFNKCGVMQVFAGDIEQTVLCQNDMVDCIGAVTPIILNGAVTEEAKALTTKAAICAIGYVSSTGDKIMFVCGNQTAGGMQGVTVANLLLSMCCTTAVITSLITDPLSSVGGDMMYMGQYCADPTAWKTPSNHAYWYVSKRPFDGWPNDFSAEIADLVQGYGFTSNEVNRLDGRIETVGEIAENAWDLAQKNADDIAIINNEIDTINTQITNLTQRVGNLETELETEINERKAADQQLQENINTEAEAREEADNELSDRITAEQTARESADQQLNTKIETETAERTAADTTLQQAINQEAIDRANADLQITNNLRQEIDAREAAVESVQQQIDDIKDGTTPVVSKIPIASATTLGGIKVGANLTITEDGVLNAEGGGGGGGTTEYTAGNGIIISGTTISAKAGSNITVDSTGINADLSSVQQQIDNIESGAQELGYVKKTGDTMSGNLNMGTNKIVSAYTATENTDVPNKGYVDSTVKVVSDEVDNILSGETPVAIPPATDNKVGGIKPGTGVEVTEDGTLNVTIQPGISQETADGRYLQLTGGTLSGDLSFSDDGNVLNIGNGGGSLYKDNGAMIIKGTSGLKMMIGETVALEIDAT